MLSVAMVCLALRGLIIFYYMILLVLVASVISYLFDIPCSKAPTWGLLIRIKSLLSSDCVAFKCDLAFDCSDNRLA